jgi:signal transduction histidine kinase
MELPSPPCAEAQDLQAGKGPGVQQLEDSPSTSKCTVSETSSKSEQSNSKIHAKQGKKDFNPRSSSRSSDGGSVARQTTVSLSKTKSVNSHGSDKTPAILKTSKSVLYGRLVFVVVLVVAAAGLGYAAYAITNNAEEQQAAERFESISGRALSVAQLVIEVKKKATDSLALMIGSANPNRDSWPNVYLDGYQQIADSLGVVTKGSLSFCPIVKPGGAEQEAFEAFAYNLFYNISGFPNTTGVSAFGRGVFSFGNDTQNDQSWPDGRFRSTGWTYHDGPNDILLPFIQSDFGAHSSLMLNVYFEHNRAAAINEVIACSEERAATLNYEQECGSITDLMWSATQADVEPGPTGMMMVPIYPRNDNTTVSMRTCQLQAVIRWLPPSLSQLFFSCISLRTLQLTGIIVGKQIWYDLLQHGFESDVNGLHVVLRTATKAHTYRVEGGIVLYVGDGELQDPNATFQTVGTQINSRYLSNNTIAYYMDIYSTEEYMDAYRTNTPQMVCIGVVLIMAFTAVLFFLFDYYVRREFEHKKKLLEAKRNFVRYISHEVRTPLNTVCMGLTLLQHDFASTLGLRRKSASGTSASPQPVAGDLDKAQVQEWMQLSTQVLQNAEAAVSVLSDMLNYDRIQMGTLKLELSLIPIWHCLERTVHEFKIAALEKQINLTLDLGPLLGEHDRDVEAPLGVLGLPADIRNCKVVGDNVKLIQVFRNLLSNGLKFSNEGGNLIVRVLEKQLPQSSRKEEIIELQKDQAVSVTRRGQVVVQIIDDGVGMTRQQVNTVFDDGTQFNANKFQSGGGSGLGMNIAKGVVSQHSGQLTADSAGMGLGCTFTVTLPLYDWEEDESSSRPDTAPSVKEVSTLEGDSDFAIPKLYVLVVDDSVTNRKLCIRLLERTGHTCEGACDGQEAVDMVKKAMKDGKPYDCILLDYGTCASCCELLVREQFVASELNKLCIIPHRNAKLERTRGVPTYANAGMLSIHCRRHRQPHVGGR